jgi:hypothetical protein
MGIPRGAQGGGVDRRVVPGPAALVTLGIGAWLVLSLFAAGRWVVALPLAVVGIVAATAWAIHFFGSKAKVSQSDGP